MNFNACWEAHFVTKKKHTKTHTFSNKVAKMSYLKTPFKKIATKMKKKKKSISSKARVKAKAMKKGKVMQNT